MVTLVLLSGGLDSAVLVAHEARHGRVLPVYVSVGLAWEAAERAMLDAFLAAPILAGRLEPLRRVEFSMRDIYAPSHWAIRGTPPAYDTPDEDVYLTGRNLVLLTKAAIVAAQAKVDRIALGSLSGNPFPDARPQFFDAMAHAASLGLDHRLTMTAPFLEWDKDAVIRRGIELGVPLELTLSCMNPVMGPSLPVHCGVCSKCRERRDAFTAANVPDPTSYRAPSPRMTASSDS